MDLLLLPTIESICEENDYDYDDDTHEDELLVQQGTDAYEIEVEDGETFEIPEDFIGQILDDDQTYYMRVTVDEEMDIYDKEEILDDLPAGKYRLDDNIITLI